MGNDAPQLGDEGALLLRVEVEGHGGGSGSPSLPGILAQQLAEKFPPGQELVAFELMARAPHPAAADVLTVIGRHHPDKKIAKLARKSAYKAATRQAARRQ